MPQKLALFSALALVAWFWFRDVKRRPELSRSLWLVVGWLIIIGSRSVSTWFDFGGAIDQATAYNEGNPIERFVYFVMIGTGLLILHKRQVPFARVVSYNIWLVI